MTPLPFGRLGERSKKLFQKWPEFARKVVKSLFLAPWRPLYKEVGGSKKKFSHKLSEMAKKLVKSLFSRIKAQSRGPFWDNSFLFFLLFNLRWAQLYVSLVSSTNIYYSAYKFGIIEGEGNMGVSYQYIALSLLCFPDPRGLQKNWCRFERRHSHCDPKQGGGRVSQYNSYWMCFSVNFCWNPIIFHHC